MGLIHVYTEDFVRLGWYRPADGGTLVDTVLAVRKTLESSNENAYSGCCLKTDEDGTNSFTLIPRTDSIQAKTSNQRPEYFGRISQVKHNIIEIEQKSSILNTPSV